jgi:hypothetical protein
LVAKQSLFIAQKKAVRRKDERRNSMYFLIIGI